MKGTIRTKQKCPVCDKPFLQIPKIGLICSEHKTVPTRFFVDLMWQGQRVKIYSHKSGRILDTFQIATETLEHIRYEIRNHQFDASHYVVSEQKQFYTSSLLERFLNQKIEGIAPSYKKDYKRMVAVANAFFKTKDVRELRKKDTIDYKNHLEKNFKIGSKTVKNTIDLFKTFMRYLKNDLEMIDTVPAFPEVEVETKPFKWLSCEDQIKILEHVTKDDKPFVIFLMLHGCRPGEARALKCKDVDLKAQTITISTTFSLNIYREKRKGRRSRPVTIPIHPEMLKFITEQVKNNLPEAFLFINKRNGKPYSDNKVFRMWDDIRTKAKINKELRLYDATRHSFASQLVNSGTTLFHVSKLLGHSSTKMTEKYAHSNIEKLKTEIAKISLKGGATVPRLSPRQKAAK